ncbi:Hypothetical_protein [Hexamita inflata]|uniref:Hypothetical_protein n=1 Tax=Hexamita inflata TaxID=28002 RepID=A0AA86UE75_9EUKA|nr:Hypothetical protein HINF_LOCUS36151 [Hexamita inflata]
MKQQLKRFLQLTLSNYFPHSIFTLLSLFQIYSQIQNSQEPFQDRLKLYTLALCQQLLLISAFKITPKAFNTIEPRSVVYNLLLVFSLIVQLMINENSKFKGVSYIQVVYLLVYVFRSVLTPSLQMILG